MSTKLFSKLKYGLSVGLALIVIGGASVNAARLQRAERVSLPTQFYFLLSEETNAQSVAYFSRLEGGAGYLTENGRVALAVYLTNEEGEQVRTDLAKRGERVSLVATPSPTLYFTGREKKCAQEYLAAIKLFEGYMQVLNGCITHLEKGMTQERCKEVLSALGNQLAYAEKEYGDYCAFAQTCRESREALSKIAEDVVYLKDLRYLLCWQAERHGELCQEFDI